MCSRTFTGLASLLAVAGLLVSAPASSSEADRSEAVPGPARLLPDVGASSAGLVEVLPDGTRRLVVSGMRILDFPDGSLERAREVLPAGTVRPPVSLPARLGGGVVFAVWVGDVTQIWRAKSWMGELEPLAAIPSKVVEIVPGFDRIYLGVSGGLRAIDPFSGQPRSVQPLPGATAIGPFAFADAWRAVAVADYRGVLTTFDAGNTWRQVPIDGHVLQVGLKSGSFVLDVPGRRLLLGTNGEVVPDDPPAAPPPPAASALLSSRNLGRRPLRAAIENGWPLRGPGGEQTAVFAQGGTLYRVALQRVDGEHPTGAILESRPGISRAEDDLCRAIPLGNDFGFVCDSPAGGSAMYAFERPFGMTEVARFEHPREISSSGNGGVVVGGSCARNEWGLTGSTTFCLFLPSGEEREMTLPDAAEDQRGGLRPVVLRDGRALVVVQPANGSSGSLLVWQGASFVTVPLLLGEREAWLRHAMIAGGVEEREPGVLGAWALSGNDLRGVRIGLDGRVTLAPSSATVQRTSVSGRYAFDWGTVGRGKESTDGGMTWSVVDMVTSTIEGTERTAAACGPVGATEGATRDARPGTWLRIGWGSPPDAQDLVWAATPSFPSIKLPEVRGVSLRCEPTGEVVGASPKPKSPPKNAAPEKKTIVAKAQIVPAPAPPLIPPRGLPPIFNPANMARTPPVAPQAAGMPSSWTAFRGTAPPPLRKDDKGLETGTETSQARIYVWGTKGADWSHSGHVQIRFDDRFDLFGTRSTAVTASPWADEEKAADALGLTGRDPMSWSSILEITGQAAVLMGQRPGRVDLYGAAQGEPVVAWRDVAGAPLAIPLPGSVVRIEGSWFFLGTPPGQGTTTAVYRVDGGIVRRLARLQRVSPQDPSFPRLTRRARGRGLGLLIRGAPDFDQNVRDWYVLAINEETGELGEPVRLYGSDLERAVPARCSPDEDGWLVMPEVIPSPALTVLAPQPVNLTFVETRLRLDPGRACIDALASREEGLVSPVSRAPSKPEASQSLDAPKTARPESRASVFDADAAIPLAATDIASGRRWLLRCGH
jgi:hypothetical protein